MDRRKKSKLKGRRRIIRVPLNLPDNIWKQYKKSLTENTNVKNYNLPVTHSMDYSNTCDRNAKDDEKQVNAAINNYSQNENNDILKNLSIRIDDSYAVKHSCLFLSNKLKESMVIHKNIHENIMNAKHILTNLSVRTVIQPHKINNSISNHLISVDAYLENVFQSMQKQELTLFNLQKTYHKMSLPLAIFNCFDIEEASVQKVSNLENNQNELNILKQKNDYLQKQVKVKNISLIKIKKNCQKHIQEKNKSIAKMKRKLYAMNERFKLNSIKSNKIDFIETDANPIYSQVQQLQNLMVLTNSLMENILGNKVQICLSDDEKGKKNEIINKLRDTIFKLKKLNKQKENEIQRLTTAQKQTEKKILVMKHEKIREDKQKNDKIHELTSNLENLRRRQDRWLTDRFYQKCHSIMLFQKLRQMELQQNDISNSQRIVRKKE